MEDISHGRVVMGVSGVCSSKTGSDKQQDTLNVLDSMAGWKRAAAAAGIPAESEGLEDELVLLYPRCTSDYRN